MRERGRAVKIRHDEAMLTREQIEQAFERLNEELTARGCRAECYLVGGAVMSLCLKEMFDARG